MSEIFLLSKFLSGLRPDIQRELRLFRPVGLGKAMDLAQMIEDKLSPFGPTPIKSRASILRGGQTPLRHRSAAAEENFSPRSTLGSKDSTAATRAGFRRLTDVEIQQHREKGLCYRSDEKFSPGHRCKRRELSVLVVQEDSDEENEIEEEFSGAEASQMAEVSLNSVMGLTNPKTLRAPGNVGV